MDIRHVLAEIVRDMSTEAIPIAYITKVQGHVEGVWITIDDPQEIEDFFSIDIDHCTSSLRVEIDSERIMQEIATHVNAIYSRIDAKLGLV